MELVEKKIDQLTQKAMKENMRVVVMGRPEPVKPKNSGKKIMDSEAKTSENTGKTICICFNYGGKWEIADAATRAIAAGETELTPETFEKPISIILKFQLAIWLFALLGRAHLWFPALARGLLEFLFIEKHFPAIEAEDCQMFLEEFHRRQRRFGK